MAETDVELILREIRERVLLEQRSGPASELSAVVSNGNRANDSAVMPGERLHNQTIAAEKLALIDSYLVTLSRAWDRLPPVVSNRSGFTARIELWIKRLLKRATRWYAWEQVNFNASVHHAIRDILQVLTSYQQELERLETTHAQQYAATRQAEAEQQQKHQSEISALRAELEKQQRTIEAQRAAIEAQRAAIEAQRSTIEAQRIESSAQLGKVLGELRERIALVQEEQRVSFKQLSLESSEAALLEERARRKTEALLDELRLKLK